MTRVGRTLAWNVVMGGVGVRAREGRGKKRAAVPLHMRLEPQKVGQPAARGYGLNLTAPLLTKKSADRLTRTRRTPPVVKRNGKGGWGRGGEGRQGVGGGVEREEGRCIRLSQGLVCTAVAGPAMVPLLLEVLSCKVLGGPGWGSAPPHPSRGSVPLSDKSHSVC